MKRILMVGLFSLLCTACKEGGLDAYEAGSQKYELSQNELEKLVVQSSSGDMQAARRLADHYLFARSDLKSAIHWYEVAAKKGDAQSMHSLYLILVRDKNPTSCRQAAYWLARAIENAPDVEFVKRNFLREDMRRMGADGSICEREKQDKLNGN